MKKVALVSSMVFLVLISCNSDKKVKETIQNIPSANISLDVQGHRGCRGLMPENTVVAMLKALELGVTTLELDVVITKDEQVILSHEPFFNHEITTKPNGEAVSEAEEKGFNIFEMNFAEVEKYDVGSRPHPRFPNQQKMKATKPLLENVFDSVSAFCNKTGISLPYFNIETKCKPETDGIYHPAPDIFVELLMNIIQKKGMEKRSMIQSFDDRTLQYLHKKYPTMATVLLVEDFNKATFAEQLTKLGFVPTVYSPHYTLVNSKLAADCKQQNIRLIPWTVNDSTSMQRLIALGVDGIISDYPDRLMKLK
ncbi:MAG: glycerophosphodiester phosphodiesterase [Ferruginibacter sp.]